MLRPIALSCLCAVITVAAAPKRAGALSEGPQIHGFVSQGYLHTDKNNYLARTKRGSLDFTEAALNVSVPLSDRIFAGMQLFTRHLGTVGEFKMTLDWAFARYHVSDWLQVTAGRFKVPYGLYNESRDIDPAHAFVLLPQGVYDQTMREVLFSANGAGIDGNIALEGLGLLNYKAIGGNLSVPSDGALTATARSIFGGRITYEPPLAGLRAGTSLLYIDANIALPLSESAAAVLQGSNLLPPDTQKLPADLDRLRVWNAFAEFRAYGWLIAAEYSLWSGPMTTALSGLGVLPIPDELDMENAYAMVAYRFASWLEIGGYYSLAFSDRKDRWGENYETSGRGPSHAAWQTDAALAMRFDIDSYLVLKAEVHAMDGGLALAFQPLDRGITERKWHLLALKATVSF